MQQILNNAKNGNYFKIRTYSEFEIFEDFWN